jgi:hypothetical protein
MLMLSSWGAVSAADVSGTYEPGEVIIQYNDIGSGTAVVSVASSLNAQIGAETILSEEILGVKGLQVVEMFRIPCLFPRLWSIISPMNMLLTQNQTI